MKNTILLIIFILLGSCSSNNDPMYRILRVEDNKLLEASNKMLKKNYVLIYPFGKANKEEKYEYFLYQKFSTVSNIVYLPQNEFYKNSVDLNEATQSIISKIHNTISSSTLFNDINKNQPNLLLRNTFKDINIYIPVYSPVFYQEILQLVGVMIYSECNYDFSNYHFKTVPQQDIIIYNDEDGEVNIKKLEKTLNDVHIKENLLLLYIGEDGFVFIGEE